MVKNEDVFKIFNKYFCILYFLYSYLRGKSMISLIFLFVYDKFKVNNWIWNGNFVFCYIIIMLMMFVRKIGILNVRRILFVIFVFG